MSQIGNIPMSVLIALILGVLILATFICICIRCLMNKKKFKDKNVDEIHIEIQNCTNDNSHGEASIT